MFVVCAAVPLIGFADTGELKVLENVGSVGVELFRSGPDTSQTSSVLVTLADYTPLKGEQKYHKAWGEHVINRIVIVLNALNEDGELCLRVFLSFLLHFLNFFPQKNQISQVIIRIG